MRHIRFFFAVFLTLGVLLTTGAQEPESGKLDLRLRLKAGQTFRCTETRESKDSEWFDMVEAWVAERHEWARTLEVTGVDEAGGATIKVTYERVAFRHKDDSSTSEYDSEETPPDEAPWWIVSWAAVIGHSYTVKVSAKGEVFELEGSETVRKAAMDALPTDETERGNIIDSVKESFTDEKLKHIAVLPRGLYPDKPVAVGDSWDAAEEALGGFLYATTYELVSRRDGLATVSCETSIKPDPDADRVKSGPYLIREALSGTRTSVFRIDENTGMIVEAQIGEDVEGKYLIRNTSTGKDEESIPVVIKSTTTLKVES